MSFVRFIILTVLICASNGFFFVPDNPEVKVRTPVGEVIGSASTVTVGNRRLQVRQFLGIPYAESPVGDRRFRKPVPKAPFSSPYHAIKAKPACFQLENDIQQSNEVSEDCLVLNIAVPSPGLRASNHSLLPVMIFIHGGGFYADSSNAYKATTLSAFGSVIVVTINYRLAALGFLSTGDSNSPGNYGLWDQHLAIQWVHDNIQAFGGNRSSVTLFGESSGATSVIYQALYPGNRGLIHRVIAESGGITSFFGSIKDYKAPLMAFAEAAGCLRNTNSEIMACLRSKTSDELIGVKTKLSDPDILLFWLPVVDGEFLVEDPWQMLNGGNKSSTFVAALQDVDLMIGVNNLDGAVLLPFWSAKYNQTDLNSFLPTEQQYQVLLSNSLKSLFKTHIPDTVKNAMSLEYTNWTDTNGYTRLANLVSMVTDHSYNVPSFLTLRAHQGSKKSFLYQFSVNPDLGHTIPVPTWMDGPTIANHFDEVLFVFGFDPEMLEKQRQIQPILGDPSSKDMEIAYAMMSMWTNFAKTGDPNSPTDVQPFLHTTCPQYDPRGQKYLEITPTMGPGSVKERLAANAMHFWLDLVPALMEFGQCGIKTA